MFSSIHKSKGEQQIKRFRLMIKRRLYEPLNFDKHRRRQLADPALEALTTDPEKQKNNLSTQYEYVLEHYESIIRAFDEYQHKIYINRFNKSRRTL